MGEGEGVLIRGGGGAYFEFWLKGGGANSRIYGMSGLPQLSLVKFKFVKTGILMNVIKG